jgi:ABC-type uncharacterized transport system permease subunit
MILTSASNPGFWLVVLALAAYAVMGLSAYWGTGLTRASLALAWIAHGATIAWGLWSGDTRFGFATAVSITAWLVLSVYALEIQWFPQMRMRRILAWFGAGAVVLAVMFPGAPLGPQASPWLGLHLVFGVGAYGLLAAAVVHARLMMRAERLVRSGVGAPNADVPLMTYERLTFRLVGAAFVLLSATLAAGWLFGETLYGPGKALRWDHKTVFSLLAWFTLAWLVVGHWRFGWRGRKALNTLYAGAALLLLAYVGSRFVLEVVLQRGV